MPARPTSQSTSLRQIDLAEAGELWAPNLGPVTMTAAMAGVVARATEDQ
jgi:hypothetical protein